MFTNLVKVYEDCTHGKIFNKPQDEIYYVDSNRKLYEKDLNSSYKLMTPLIKPIVTSYSCAVHDLFSILIR